MHQLIVFMIVAVTSFRFLVSQGWLPQRFVYAPELISLVVAIYVIVRGAQSRYLYVRPNYWILFGGLLIGVICGALINGLEAGPTFAGLRTFLRAIPLFFLPAAFFVTETRLQKYVAILLGACLIQLPLAVHQRLNSPTAVSYTGMEFSSGDFTYGTLMNSGMLTVFLISAACILTGFMIKGRVPNRVYWILLPWILLPITINETKVALVLLPVALLTVAYAGASPGKRLKNLLLSLVLAGMFLAAFIPIYDYYMQPRWGYGILDFFTMEGRLEGYLYRGVEVGDQVKGGRIDGLVAAAAFLSGDPAKLFFGVGIGNASDSALGAQFSGRYYELFTNFPDHSMTILLLELGVLGVALVLALHVAIIVDALDVARRDTGIFGALATGWVGVGVVVLVALLYGAPITNLAVSYLFWTLSGVLMAQRRRLEFDRASEKGLSTALAGVVRR